MFIYILALSVWLLSTHYSVSDFSAQRKPVSFKPAGRAGTAAGLYSQKTLAQTFRVILSHRQPAMMLLKKNFVYLNTVTTYLLNNIVNFNRKPPQFCFKLNCNFWKPVEAHSAARPKFPFTFLQFETETLMKTITKTKGGVVSVYTFQR